MGKNVVASGCGLLCVIFWHLPEESAEDSKKLESGVVAFEHEQEFDTLTAQKECHPLTSNLLASSKQIYVSHKRTRS
jgi:hypothetical protein